MDSITCKWNSCKWNYTICSYLLVLLLSFSIVFCRFIHVVVSHSSITLLCGWIFHLPDRPHFTYVNIDSWVVYTLWVPWIMLLWTFMYKILQGHIFSSLLSIYLLSSGIVGLCGKSMFYLLRNFQSAFQNSYITLQSPQ